MQGIVGVDFLQGDFCEVDVLLQFEVWLDNQKVDFVLLDMVFNMSGVVFVDQICLMDLVELVLDFSWQWFKFGGLFLIKLFQGMGFDDYFCSLCVDFLCVIMCKFKVFCVCLWEVYVLVVGLKVGGV